MNGGYYGIETTQLGADSFKTRPLLFPIHSSVRGKEEKRGVMANGRLVGYEAQSASFIVEEDMGET